MTLAIEHRRILSRGDIPESGGGIYNPGAVLVDGTIVLLCRREIDYRFTTNVYPERVDLDPATLAVLGHRTLTRGSFRPGCRIEDFRPLFFDGQLLVVHNLVNATRIKPVLSRVIDDRLQLVDDLALPIAARAIEKNWVLFLQDGALYCLYQLDPLTICVRARHRVWRLVKEDDANGWAAEFSRTLSNSTNLIPFRGGHLGFWHTILHHRYVQGAFWLGRNLEITYRTGILLDGAEVREGFKPGVLYVSSIVQHGERILAFYGEGDAHTSVAIFDAGELWRELTRCAAPRAEPAIRIRYVGTTVGDLFHAMCTLQRFSEQRGHPRIHLYVGEDRLRTVIAWFKIPDLQVYHQGGRRQYDYELRAGSLRQGSGAGLPAPPRSR